MKTRDSFTATSFEIIGDRNLPVDECGTAHCFGGLKLELKDKDGDIIAWIRLTDEQGVPLIDKIW